MGVARAEFDRPRTNCFHFAGKTRRLHRRQPVPRSVLLVPAKTGHINIKSRKKIVEIITNDKETGLGLTQTKFFEEAHWRDVRSPVVSSSLPFFVEGVVIQPEREK
jgi:hypothetical protein